MPSVQVEISLDVHAWTSTDILCCKCGHQSSSKHHVHGTWEVLTDPDSSPKYSTNFYQQFLLLKFVIFDFVGFARIVVRENRFAQSLPSVGNLFWVWNRSRVTRTLPLNTHQPRMNTWYLPFSRFSIWDFFLFRLASERIIRGETPHTKFVLGSQRVWVDPSPSL